MFQKKEAAGVGKEASGAKPAGQSADVKRLPQSFNDAARRFLQSEIEKQKLLRNLAFAGAGAAAVIAAICGVVAAIAVTKQPEPEVTILEHDRATGVTTVLHGLKGGPVTFDEATKRQWLKTYVETCESYDWWTIQSTADACKLMSTDKVGAAYIARIQAPDAPLALLKDKGKVIARVSGTTFLGDNVAQVRYALSTYDLGNPNSDKPVAQTYWIETVSFEFDPTRKMTDAEREINSLGFTVLTTRNDKQVAQ